MKQIKLFFLLVISILISVVLIGPNLEEEVITQNNFTTNTILSAFGCNYGQCHATAKSTGNRCLHCVSNSGDLYCWQHNK